MGDKPKTKRAPFRVGITGACECCGSDDATVKWRFRYSRELCEACYRDYLSDDVRAREDLWSMV